MPYPKNKEETYNCQGGINTKISLYLANEGEFLNLQNVDFRKLGALTSAAGSTQFTIQSSTTPITGLAAYNHTPGISYAAVATDYVHVSTFTGATFVSIFNYLFPATTAPFGSSGGAVPTSFASASMLFGANGWDFWGYGGGTVGAWHYSLPPPAVGPGVSDVVGAGSSGVAGGFTGTVTAYYAFVGKAQGFQGPASGTTATPFYGSTWGFVQNPAFQNQSTTFGIITPESFGLSFMRFWLQANNATPQLYVGANGITYINSVTGGTVNMTFAVLPGGSFFAFNSGGSFANAFTTTTILPSFYEGSFLYSNFGFLDSGSLNPSIIETYANQLFMAGFAQFPTRVVYSDPGAPEVVDPQNFIDVDIGDKVTALRKFFSSLMIWKFKSTFVLTGTGPDTFVLTQASDNYGCISKNACVVWNQVCWFLDAKGIIEFNGANAQCVSNKVEDVFNRMNVPVAATTAVMVHVKDRNEVWTAIPIDGATDNNIIVIFDYLANAWTTRTIVPGTMTAMNTLTLGPNKTSVYYGLTSGSIGTFGSSFTGDNGAAFTCVIKSCFMEDLGNSVTKVFRRLFTDATVPAGQTQVVAINFYADKNTVPYYSTTMALSSAFQNRIDFGIPAKSIAVEFIYSLSGASFFQLNGFTIESRFQRAV